MNSPKHLRELAYIRGYQDFSFFVEQFFGHHLEFDFSTMHEDFIRAEEKPDKRGRREVIAAPRGNAKTTFKVLFKVIHAIVYGYEPFIVIIGHSAPEAENKVADILNELENNKKLIEVYGQLAPLRGKGRWGNKRFETQNGCLVMAKSRLKQVRGLKHGEHRPSLIILDDVESSERVLTEEQRYKTRSWFEKDILKLGKVDGSANVFVIGTCLHPESLLSELLAMPSWESARYQAVKQFSSNQALWNEWKSLYTELSDPKRAERAQAFFDKNRALLLEGTEVLWPAGESYLQLMKIMVNEGIASFQSEKQNDPYDPDRQIFNMAEARQFKFIVSSSNELTGLQWLHGSKRVVPVHHLERIVAFHDPVLADNKDSDYAAIVVVAIDFDGYFYCLDAYIERVVPSRQITQAYWLQAKWGFEKLYLESNNFQGILKDNYRDSQEQHPEQPLRVISVNQHQNKEKRISSLEPLITNGQLLFAEDLTQRFINQMSLFPTSHDDGPDALHGAVEQLRKRPNTVTFTQGYVPA